MVFGIGKKDEKKTEELDAEVEEKPKEKATTSYRGEVECSTGTYNVQFETREEVEAFIAKVNVPMPRLFEIEEDQWVNRNQIIEIRIEED